MRVSGSRGQGLSGPASGRERIGFRQLSFTVIDETRQLLLMAIDETQSLLEDFDAKQLTTNNSINCPTGYKEQIIKVSSAK